MLISSQSDRPYLSQLNRLAIRIDQKNFLGKMPQKSQLHAVKNLMEENQETDKRKQQNLILYFINLFILIVVTYLNGSQLLEFNNNVQQKGILIIIFVVIGFFFAIISNVQIAPWREVLKLYFLVDSLIPVMISAVIGFYTVIKNLSSGEWYVYGLQISFPFWVFYLGGSLRVLLAFLSWNRWQIVIFKLTLLGCGMFNFYVGFIYMTGAYKVSMGYDKSLDETVKGLIYLYVFGLVQLVYEYYRRISDFDQTKELKFEYRFQSNCEMQDQLYINEAQDSYQKQKRKSNMAKGVSKINESNVSDLNKLKKGFSRFLSIRNTYDVCQLD